ncbi:MAG: two-component system sensor histidine kinase RegB [Oceanicoccus sp.]|jgi:two-component system sensor histidine kinase RegB
MIAAAAHEHLAGNHTVVLSRILLLRIVVLTIALASISFFYFVLDRNLSFGALLAVVFVGYIYSVITYGRLRRKTPVTDHELFIHILVDSILIVILVSLSGGASNPFIYYLLVMVAICSTLFEKSVSWLFCFLAISAYTFLLYWDIQEHVNHLFSDFQLHLVGMWVNFVGSAILICFFISRLAHALRDRQIHLAYAREEALRQEQLVGIGTLAASTVHALRTPLSTIAILLNDIKLENKNRELDGDISLLLTQVDRCKKTTNRLATLADTSDDEKSYELLIEFICSLEEHYQLINLSVMPIFTIDEPNSHSFIQNHILLQQAVQSLIDNAIHAAKSKVTIRCGESDGFLSIEISDDGPGIPPDIAVNWGKPFFSKKEGGLGVGIFLANSTIERFGGGVTLNTNINAKDNEATGTSVCAQIPLIEKAQLR